MKINLERLVLSGKTALAAMFMGISSLFYSCNVELMTLQSKPTKHGIYYQQDVSGGLNINLLNPKLDSARTSFNGNNCPSYSDPVNLTSSPKTLFSADLKLDNFLGSDFFKIGAGASYNYFLRENCEKHIEKKWIDGSTQIAPPFYSSGYLPEDVNCAGFSHKVTGYNADPWDVAFFGGAPIIYSFEPFVSARLEIPLVNPGTNTSDRPYKTLRLDAGIGFPYAEFEWQKFYFEQLEKERGNSGFTFLEKDISSAWGKSINLGVTYVASEAKDQKNKLMIGITFSRQKYSVNIMDKNTSITNYVCAIKLIDEF